MRSALAYALLLISLQPWVAVSGATTSISYAYSYTLAPFGSSFLQSDSSGGTATASCSSPDDCRSKCPNSTFLGDGNASVASVQQQLFDCANAVRTSPESFTDAINAVCKFEDFRASVTQPRRSALQSSQGLADLAEAHSNDMAANNTLSHASTTGQSPADRIRASFPDTNSIGELIAAGFGSVQAVIVNMICSESHRAILTGCEYDTAGWGVEYGNTINGQPIRTQYNSYFTGDLLCSSPNGCSCPGAVPAPSPGSQAAAAPQGSPAAALAVSFQLAFEDISDGSLNGDQSASVAQDIKDAILAYISPAFAGIKVTGNGLSTSNTGRRLLQSENTLQATVSFRAVTSAATSADSSSLINALTADIKSYITQATVTVSATPDTSGSTLALQVSVQFPPNNQVSTSPSYTTELASSFASAATNQTASVFPKFIAQNGQLQITGTQTAVVPVSATAASNLGPPAPIPVVGSGNTSPPATGGTPPTSQPPPVAAPTTQPPPVAAPTTQPSPPPVASPVSQLPPVAVPATQPPPVAAPTSQPLPSPTVAVPAAGPTSQPPASAPWVVQVVVTLRGNESAMVQNLTQALQANPQGVLYPLIARDGNVTVSNVVSSDGDPASVESAPIAAPAAAPAAAPSAATAPAQTSTTVETPMVSVPTSVAPAVAASPAATVPIASPVAPATAAAPAAPVPVETPAAPVPASTPAAPVPAATTVAPAAGGSPVAPTTAASPQAPAGSSGVPATPAAASPVAAASPQAPAVSSGVPATPAAASSPGAVAPAPAANATGCALFALNMQFSSGRAETDQSTAALLAARAGPSAPPASRFNVQLSNSSSGAIDAVLPYGSSNYLLQVSTPEAYLGPVTVVDTGSQQASLTYYKVSSLIVRVTASSLTSAMR